MASSSSGLVGHTAAAGCCPLLPRLQNTSGQLPGGKVCVGSRKPEVPEGGLSGCRRSRGCHALRGLWEGIRRRGSGKWEEAERGRDVGEGDERGEARSYLHTSSH